MRDMLYLPKTAKSASNVIHLKRIFYDRFTSEPYTIGRFLYNLWFRFHFMFARFCLKEIISQKSWTMIDSLTI